MLNKIEFKLAYISCLLIIPLGLIFTLDPIAQSQKYHLFADQSHVLGITHFYDVITNIFFAVIALWGLVKIQDKTKWPFLMGVLLVAPGSAYYHLLPTDERLLWDRLPMVIAFCSLSSWLFIKFFKISGKRSLYVLFLSNFVGLTSILYWVFKDDLRFYYWVQLAPILLLCGVSLLYSKLFNNRLYIFFAFSSYILAKILEHNDLAILNFMGISGHSLKHCFAAVAVYFLIKLDVIDKNSHKV
ncbi:MAG: hypothetical protein QF441_05015 [Bacteriovoracaceae bacterium]|jgi:hypothetical protein|nr:hypothetical protein [Halobacteriovoraceae bacterium]MDP7319944.1 hypothetical protein [Bacteriovoracaceae bacterium]